MHIRKFMLIITFHEAILSSNISLNCGYGYLPIE